MMNFGETLAYWYLRLNGFFPLANFVVHHGKEQQRSRADVDLLAIRFPHVYEEIGGQIQDWDREHFEHWGIPLLDSIIGLVVEVKTGDARDFRLNRSFSNERIEYALGRFGFVEHHEIGVLVDGLSDEALLRIEDRNITIAKLLISVNAPRDDGIPFLFLPLEELNQFIENRMGRYIDRKRGERTFFPDDLIQYLIWKRELDLG